MHRTGVGQESLTKRREVGSRSVSGGLSHVAVRTTAPDRLVPSEEPQEVEPYGSTCTRPFAGKEGTCRSHSETRPALYWRMPLETPTVIKIDLYFGARKWSDSSAGRALRSLERFILPGGPVLNNNLLCKHFLLKSF